MTFLFKGFWPRIRGNSSSLCCFSSSYHFMVGRARMFLAVSSHFSFWLSWHLCWNNKDQRLEAFGVWQKNRSGVVYWSLEVYSFVLLWLWHTCLSVWCEVMCPVLFLWELLAFSISLTAHSKLCLMGIAETLGCASLLPASLFSNSNTGSAHFLGEGLCMQKSYNVCVGGGSVFQPLQWLSHCVTGININDVLTSRCDWTRTQMGDSIRILICECCRLLAKEFELLLCDFI